MDAASVQQLESLLLQINVPNTRIVQAAEKQVRTALRKRECVLAMMRLLRFSQHSAVRQLCAVLLRLRLGDIWERLAPEAKEEAKAMLLDSLRHEPERIVSLNTVYVVSAVGRREMKEEGMAGWKQLVVFLTQLAQSESPQNQELAMRLFFALTETVGTVFQPHFQDLRELYGRLLQQSTNTRVRIAALKAAGALVDFLSSGEDVLVFRDLVPLIIQGLEANCRDEALSVQVIDVLSQLAESPVPILNRYINNVVLVLLEILRSGANVEAGTKQAAGVALCRILACKSRFVTKQKLVIPILKVGVLCLSREYGRFSTILAKQELSQEELARLKSLEGDDGDEDDEEDEECYDLGPRIIGALSHNVNARQIMEPLVRMAFERIEGRGSFPVEKSANVDERELSQWLGLSLLIHSTAGLAEEYADPAVLDEMIKRVLPLAHNSPSSMLRAVALMCLTEWVENLSPAIWTYMPALLPHGVQLLGDGSVLVRSCACDLIELISDDIDEEVMAPYLGSLVQNLLSLAQHGANASVRSTALSALSSVMVTSGRAFMEYFDETCRVLGALAILSDEPLLQVRGYATSALGSLALACSRENENRENNLERFRPLVDDVLAHATKGLEFEDMELNRLTYAMLGNLAAAFQEAIAPCTEQVAEILVFALHMDDNMEISVQDPEGVLLPTSVREKFSSSPFKDLNDSIPSDETSELPEDTYDEDAETTAHLGVRYEFSVRMEVIEAKQAALCALGQLVENAPTQRLRDLLESILSGCIRCLGHVHSETKICAIQTISQVVHAYARTYELNSLSERAQAELLKWGAVCFKEIDPDKRWLVGLPPRYKLPAKIEEVLNETIKPNCFQVIRDERDKSVVAASFETLEKIAAFLGPTAFVSDSDRLIELCISVLNGKATCQRLDHLDDDFEEDDDDDLPGGRPSATLLESVCDLLGMLAQAMGPSFASYMPPVLKSLLAKAHKGGVSTQVTICGAIAEIITGVGPSGIDPFVKDLVFYALPTLGEDQPLARRNAAFLLGNIVCLAGESLQSDSQGLFRILQALEPLLAEAVEVDQTAAQAKAANLPLNLDTTDVQAVVDNACGALARVLLCAAPGTIPLESAFGILLTTLPLRFDFSENYAVCSCVLAFLKSRDSNIQKLVEENFGHIVSKIAETLVTIETEGTTPQICAKQTVREIFQLLLDKDKNRIMQILRELPDEQRRCVQNL